MGFGNDSGPTVIMPPPPPVAPIAATPPTMADPAVASVAAAARARARAAAGAGQGGTMKTGGQGAPVKDAPRAVPSLLGSAGAAA